MTPEDNSPAADPLSDPPPKPSVIGLPISNETAEEALKAVIAIRAHEASASLKHTTDYSHGGIND